MARELDCARSTIGDAIDLLLETGWIERAPLPRNGKIPAEGEQPFSAYRYRVRLDRDDLPGRILSDSAPADLAEKPAGGADIPAGGAAPEPAPNEGLSEGISSEPERESARAREEMPVAKFLKKWPTAAVDDHARITKEWQGLSADDQHAAMAGIDAFLARLKTEGRKHIIAGWKYLAEKRWKLIEDQTEKVAQAEIHTWSREWWAELFHRINTGQSTSFMLRYAMERAEKRVWYGKPSDAEVASLTAYAANGPEMAAWRPWFEARRIRFPVWHERFSIFLPAPTPDGQLATDEDLQQFAKTG
jgi:hypothetical protein